MNTLQKIIAHPLCAKMVDEGLTFNVIFTKPINGISGVSAFKSQADAVLKKMQGEK